jgi:hypothetical protein
MVMLQLANIKPDQLVEQRLEKVSSLKITPIK